MKVLCICLLVLATIFNAASQKKTDKKEGAKLPYDASTVSSLSFRMVGPALTSGRVADIAVHPKNKDKWFVAAASGGVWYTANHGITFSPIFDNYGSYSIACVELAPSNPNTVWVGTGENNNQRSVAYGDGVYKSLDGGKSFVNMGLKTSEHIGNIIIHPTDENTVWVAAYGPLWSCGGERGVYKTTDGGKTWERTLFVSEETGIAEIAIDPENPMILYASAHQRRRHEWTYIGGGPESTLYKSTDGGKTWREISAGLPKQDMGRVGIAVAPSDPNYMYAIVEARYGKAGVYLSTNKGESWSKQGDFNTSGNYYQEIMIDPLNKKKIFAMDTYLHHSEDAGKTFVMTGESNKHVDNHAIWIDPDNTDHWIVGCDGGVYETYTHAKEWKYYSNLPIIQFYKVTTDNATPFYNIYGGTQDNNSMGGPAATTNVAGILNSDWYITNGGDGFESACDWSNPSIAYAQAQYGWLVRYDKVSGEKVPIQPMPGKGEEAYRWNWDAPLIVSSHDPSVLYFAANKLFKSNNRGDDWSIISPDLTRQLDRNKLKVMGQVWTIDAVMKNASTTIYGNVVALDESPKKKGLLYVGTDDGLIQVSENDGGTWTKIEQFPGVPVQTRVNMLTASSHDENVVFATFNSQRNGDFKPYLLKSTDKGKSWFSIASNLPERGNAYCIKQDHIDPNLLFVGTEFGAFFSTDGGQNWTKLAGLPTIAVYDLDIQKRENDLVAATFGRGFYVLDNYSMLRELKKETLDKRAHLFKIKEALLYVPMDPLGLEGTGFQGHNMWSSKNPSFGATFYLHFNESWKSLKDKRQEKEKELEKAKKDVFYPTFNDLAKEELETSPYLVWSIVDASGKEIKRTTSASSKGVNMFNWNLRTQSTNPIGSGGNGLLVTPGTYFLSVYYVNPNEQKSELLIEKSSFQVKGLNNQTLLAKNPEELFIFREEVRELNRKIGILTTQMAESKDQINQLSKVIVDATNVPLELSGNIQKLKEDYRQLNTLVNGDNIKFSREFETAPSLTSRFGMLEYQLYDNTTGVTKTHRANKSIVELELVEATQQYTRIKDSLNEVINKLRNAGVPYIKNAGSWKNE
ncbi:MAG: VPS10 domain-containing protein [Crocinitomicaceae bacterium]